MQILPKFLNNSSGGVLKGPGSAPILGPWPGLVPFSAPPENVESMFIHFVYVVTETLKITTSLHMGHFSEKTNNLCRLQPSVKELVQFFTNPNTYNSYTVYIEIYMLMNMTPNPTSA